MTESRFTWRRLLRAAIAVVVVLTVLSGVGWTLRYEILRRMEGLPPYTHSAGAEREERVTMPDGARLATTVFTPAGTRDRWPTVLIRNPYERFDMVARGWCGRLIRYGYACVYQDVRGQMGSEGDWEPLVNEGVDGKATLEWLVSQPFQDGNIAMMGPSYLAALQWAAAVDFPPEVKTFVPSVSTANTHAAVYQDGMFRHETFTAWTAMMPRRGYRDGDVGGQYQQAIRHRPHVEVDERYFGGRLSWYREWITSPSPSDPLWQREDNQQLLAAPTRISIPILMVGGWYDVFLGPQLGDWQRLATRSRSRFVVGPWTHVGGGGEALETPGAGGGLLQWELLLDWFGHHLRGEPLENPPGVATYVMRENRWVTREAWPPATRPRRFHLQRSSEARACGGGVLAGAVPEQVEKGGYLYDPDDPVPTRGGAGMLAFVLPGFGGAPAGNVWQDALCERSDVLSFTSDPLEVPLPIAGEIEVGLTVASDALDTAFTAKLVEVLPDGRAMNIRDGITSLAFRNGAQAPVAYTPGEKVEIRISLWPIEWTVPEGSRLRLDISSSDFPKYHVHPNRPGVWSEVREVRKAQQTLWTGPELSGWLSLPVAR